MRILLAIKNEKGEEKSTWRDLPFDTGWEDGEDQSVMEELGTDDASEIYIKKVEDIPFDVEEDDDIETLDSVADMILETSDAEVMALIEAVGDYKQIKDYSEDYEYYSNETFKSIAEKKIEDLEDLIKGAMPDQNFRDAFEHLVSFVDSDKLASDLKHDGYVETKYGVIHLL